MRWPWKREPSSDVDEAQQHLDKLQSQELEVRQLTRELREAQRRNHFAAMIVNALRGTS